QRDAVPFVVGTVHRDSLGCAGSMFGHPVLLRSDVMQTRMNMLLSIDFSTSIGANRPSDEGVRTFPIAQSERKWTLSVAIRRAKQKQQVIEKLSSTAPAGETFIATVHCET